MDDKDIRMEALKLALSYTPGGSSWDYIIAVADRFADFVSNGAVKVADE